MTYEVIAVETFQKDVKHLYKKYKSIKQDLLELVEKLEKDYSIGTDLGGNLYKIRVRNRDVGGKRGGYRVIYYTRLPNNKIYLLTIYAKTQKETIDISALKPIIDALG